MKIELRKIALSFDDKPPLLQGLDLVLDAGDFALVHGPSGCGKSSLLRLLNRLQEPSAGEILVDDRPVGDYEVTGLRRRMGFIQQTPVVVAGSVRENLLYPFRFKALRGQAPPGDEVLRGWLDDLLLTTVQFDDEAATLSVGQQQRLALIRTLLVEPDILLCDEPTSALDADSKEVVDAWLGRAHMEHGIGVVLVSHLDFAPEHVHSRRYVVRGQHLEEERA
ncbi:MAG: ATP-binding cassette domain-containing protein [Candidatus Latescibacterota bacterium]|nr:ATP-binding cassette domain-containing protein [Candidatus Latescibacterota bacterium]